MLPLKEDFVQHLQAFGRLPISSFKKQNKLLEKIEKTKIPLQSRAIHSEEGECGVSVRYEPPDGNPIKLSFKSVFDRTVLAIKQKKNKANMSSAPSSRRGSAHTITNI